MTTEVVAGAIGELRAASTAAGGTALTTTAGYIQLPLKTSHIYLIPRNFDTGVVVQFTLNPWLVVLKTTDGLATPPTDYSDFAQDANDATVIDVGSLDTLANGGALLVGSHIKFRGARVDMTATVNATASVLTVKYWNGSTWTSTGATDGTIVATGKTFGQDGTVAWTVPATWALDDLLNMKETRVDFPVARYRLYWTRWEVSAQLDSATIESMVAMNRSTAYAELLPNQPLELKVKHGEIGGLGCIEAKVNAGTANLIVNVASLRGEELR